MTNLQLVNTFAAGEANEGDGRPFLSRALTPMRGLAIVAPGHVAYEIPTALG